MVILGLTGGIASGKSTVAAWISARGVLHVDADLLARDAVAPGSPGLAAVAARFGRHLVVDGRLDRKILGALVFADEPARRDLEAIVHPLILADIAARLDAARAAGPAVALVDAALLFEMGLDRHCDATLAVVCSAQTQLDRLLRRDGLGAEAAAQRLAAQLGHQERRVRATWTIDNDGGLADLEGALERWWAIFSRRFDLDA